MTIFSDTMKLWSKIVHTVACVDWRWLVEVRGKELLRAPFRFLLQHLCCVSGCPWPLPLVAFHVFTA